MRAEAGAARTCPAGELGGAAWEVQGVLGADLAARLTAAVAVSMALTPPMMTAYERIADKVKAGKPARTATDLGTVSAIALATPFTSPSFA